MIMQPIMQSIRPGLTSNLFFIAVIGCVSVGIGIGIGSNAWAASTVDPAPSFAPDPAMPPPPRKITDIAEPLSGTLFFSREQRERIDRARQRGEVVVEENVVIAVRNQPSIINGFVKRSDGKNVVWVDGEIQGNISKELSDEIVPMSVGGSSQWLHVSSKPAPVFNRAKIISKSPIKKQRRLNKTKSFKPRLLGNSK